MRVPGLLVHVCARRAMPSPRGWVSRKLMKKNLCPNFAGALRAPAKFGHKFFPEFSGDPSPGRSHGTAHTNVYQKPRDTYKRVPKSTGYKRVSKTTGTQSPKIVSTTTPESCRFSCTFILVHVCVFAIGLQISARLRSQFVRFR